LLLEIGPITFGVAILLLVYGLVGRRSSAAWPVR
jgi:hypothetical protein